MYESIKSPFRSLPALNLERMPELPVLATSPDKPRVDLLSKFANMIPRDVTRVEGTPSIPTLNPVEARPVVRLPAQLTKEEGFNFEKFKTQTGKRESDNRYGITNKQATGKYQFLWDLWGEPIKKYTGVRTRQEFLKSPKAQESFFEHYTKTTIQPAVKKLAEAGKQLNLSETEVARVVHFQGEPNAAKAFAQGIKGISRSTRRNPSILAYLNK